MNVIDFTGLERTSKTYAGIDGNKISVIYNGKTYMLKFPAHAGQNEDKSYNNYCFSEYLSCHVYESVGIPVQETLSGIFRNGKRQNLVVACRDFTEPDMVLQDFASLKKQLSPPYLHAGSTELSEILYIIDHQTLMDRDELTERFWDMFIVDAFIGNWDRHNGNWGLLRTRGTEKVRLAPVYDCASSLYPQASFLKMEAMLSHRKDAACRVLDTPSSAITINGQKINYYQFLSSLQNKNCNLALKRIVPKIDLRKISRIIEDTPFISRLQVEFYKAVLTERKQKILDISLQKLLHYENRPPESLRPGGFLSSGQVFSPASAALHSG